MEDQGVLTRSPLFRRRALAGVLAVVAVSFAQGCALYHHYEGYQGRVVDKETGKPIAGAGVFVKYYKKSPTVGGDVSHFVRATHALTDENGEFRIPADTVFNARYLFSWFVTPPDFALYAPGYTVYPRHPESAASVGDKTSKEPVAGQYMTILLRRLRTVAETRENYVYASWILDAETHDDPSIQIFMKMREADYHIIESGR